MAELTPRGKALRWLTNHRYLTEQPAGSNTDRRRDGIRKAQIDCANGGSWLIRQPWCGVWCFNALQAAGVKHINSRMAAVAYVEDDARAKRGCYRGWTHNPKAALRGDLVVLFGRGVHVETVRSTAWVYRRIGLIRTEGGNTNSGNRGSQSNGGGSFPRYRRLADVRDYALVDYPG